jgi:TetR/AcrR family transcriptional regulator
VLDAGLEIFSTVGLHGASLDQIALRAGLSKTNLLYYFRNSREARGASRDRVIFERM